MKQLSYLAIKAKKGHEKLTMLTAYDATMARLIDRLGIDIILVGDSLGNVIQGHQDTLSVTMDEMIYHASAVMRANPRALVVVDMPYMSTQLSVKDAKKNASRLVKEGGAQAVKIELMGTDMSAIEAIVEMGIPVMAHLGFTPQWLPQIGGYKMQGDSLEQQTQLLAQATACEKAGCFSIVLEMVPQAVAKQLTQTVGIPTIGIGAGRDCDGQVLVSYDLLGLSENAPSFSRAYVDVAAAIEHFKSDVDHGRFPADAEIIR